MNEALRHGSVACNANVSISFIEAEQFETDPDRLKVLKKYDGIFVPYGFGPRGAEGKISAISFARKNDIPFLGICYGFQLAVVEFARNVCGLKQATSTEINPNTSEGVVDLMPEQKEVEWKGATMRLGAHKILVKKGSLAHKLYGTAEIFQRHRHRFEVNMNYLKTLEKGGLIFSGESTDGRRMEILELPEKFFFFASQFHGEFKSRPGKPDPEYYGFIKACLDRKLARQKA